MIIYIATGFAFVLTLAMSYVAGKATLNSMDCEFDSPVTDAFFSIAIGYLFILFFWQVFEMSYKAVLSIVAAVQP